VGANEPAYRAAEQRYWAVEGAAPAEHWVTLPRLGTRVRVQVVGEGPPVLFVHGVNVNGTCWAPLVARLGDFRCLLVDRPGCGLSEAVSERVNHVAAFAAYADDLLADVLDGLELERVDVVATSLGGYHALRTAAAHPDRVRRAVALGWSVGAPNGPIPLVMRLAGVRSLGRVMARMPVPKRAVRSMLGQIGLAQALEAGRLPDEGVDWFHALINHTHTVRNEIDAGPALIQLRSGMSDLLVLGDDVLGRIRAPMRFIWGAEDPFGGADVATAFVAKFHGASLEVMAGAGHAVWMDDPDHVAKEVGAFLGG
jgi:pimeloyl-ACP methyl ester carboxylesterase